MEELTQAFFARPSFEVAPQLLNKVLVAGPVSGRIIEVEAYGGQDDSASHGWRGRTPRTEPMFGPPGHWYVYLSYGVHWCLNAVTNADGDCGAVLIRAVAPLTGVEVMAKRRGRRPADRQLVDGPGKLTQAFAVTGQLDATAISLATLGIACDGTAPPREPGVTPRIGINPRRDAERLARFVVPGTESGLHRT